MLMQDNLGTCSILSIEAFKHKTQIDMVSKAHSMEQYDTDPSGGTEIKNTLLSQ